jgi:hypothetical protein
MSIGFAAGAAGADGGCGGTGGFTAEADVVVGAGVGRASFFVFARAARNFLYSILDTPVSTSFSKSASSYTNIKSSTNLASKDSFRTFVIFSENLFHETSDQITMRKSHKTYVNAAIHSSKSFPS